MWKALVHRVRGLLAAACFGATALGGPAVALAQEDPPGRVGRVADLNGGVSWFDADQGEWVPAERNRPLTSGDRIATANDGRAELRIGSTVLRLSNRSELELLRLDDQKMVFQLHSGSLALRVKARETAIETELITDEARLLPQRAGHYRLDRLDDVTQAGSWRGELRVDDDGPDLTIGTGQRLELTREGRGNALRVVSSALPNDGFEAWVTADEQREERTAATRHVSPEMTGAEELDRFGRWGDHPDYGAIWTPGGLRADWAPYRYGRWTWVQPWGWTWVDDTPWGFAPFHYGRWVFWRNHWGWVPGAYVARPVFAPALVAWVGGPRWGVSINIGGGPAVGWLPLAPREVYRPHYRHTPIYVDRVNPGPPNRWQHPPRHVPTGPIMYGNQGVPNAVTVVPGDVIKRRQPVQHAAIDARPGHIGPPSPGAIGAPLAPGFAPPGPDRVRDPGRPGGQRGQPMLPRAQEPGWQRGGREPRRDPGREDGDRGRGPQPMPQSPGFIGPRPESRPENRPEVRPEAPQAVPQPRPDRGPDRGDRGESQPGRGPGGGRPFIGPRPQPEAQPVPQQAAPQPVAPPVAAPQPAQQPPRMAPPQRSERPAERTERPERVERPERAEGPRQQRGGDEDRKRRPEQPGRERDAVR